MYFITKDNFERVKFDDKCKHFVGQFIASTDENEKRIFEAYIESFFNPNCDIDESVLNIAYVRICDSGNCVKENFLWDYSKKEDRNKMLKEAARIVFNAKGFYNSSAARHNPVDNCEFNYLAQYLAALRHTNALEKERAELAKKEKEDLEKRIDSRRNYAPLNVCFLIIEAYHKVFEQKEKIEQEIDSKNMKKKEKEKCYEEKMLPVLKDAFKAGDSVGAAAQCIFYKVCNDDAKGVSKIKNANKLYKVFDQMLGYALDHEKQAKILEEKILQKGNVETLIEILRKAYDAVANDAKIVGNISKDDFELFNSYCKAKNVVQDAVVEERLTETVIHISQQKQTEKTDYSKMQQEAQGNAKKVDKKSSADKSKGKNSPSK